MANPSYKDNRTRHFANRQPSAEGETRRRFLPACPWLRYTRREEERFGGILAAGLEESDIRSGLAEGGRLLGVFIVERPLRGGPGYIAYLRTSWKRGFRGLRTYRARSDRVYRDLDRLVRLIRDEFNYGGPITVSVAGAPELRRFRALLPRDTESTLVSRAPSKTVLPARSVRKRL